METWDLGYRGNRRREGVFVPSYSLAKRAPAPGISNPYSRAGDKPNPALGLNHIKPYGYRAFLVLLRPTGSILLVLFKALGSEMCAHSVVGLFNKHKF